MVETHPNLKASAVRANVGGTSAEHSAVRPAVSPSPPTPAAEAQPKKFVLAWPLLVGGAVVLACLALGGVFLANNLFNGAARAATETPALPESTQTLPATSEQVVAPLVTETLSVTETPAVTATPEATATAETPYVVITDIQVQGNLYVVDYEVHNFPEEANLHVHIFFDTVPPDQAGSPASGPWKLTWGVYGNPPFTQYGIANRPPNATQLCSLVANPNHSVQPNSGNCVNLPE